jgi:Uma2 family endonuclease
MAPMAGENPMRGTAPAVKLTYDDFLRFPDDGKRHELIDGVHYVTSSPNLKHQVILGNLYLPIGTWLETHAHGRLFLSPFDVIFSEFDVVEPDLLFIGAARLADILTPLNVRGAPDLVVEIGSRSTRRRDETIKRTLYERAGVDEYWIVDPVLDAVHVHRRLGARYAPVENLLRHHEETLRTPLLPGFDLPLRRIFRDT